MTVETVTYITDFNTAYPDGGDAKSEGDNHIRNIKTGIGGTFPNFTGIAMTATEAELNLNDGAIAGTSVANKTLALGATKNTDELVIDTALTASTAMTLGTVDVMADVSGFVRTNAIYVDSNGSGASTFDVGANIAAAWESIGPTGSSATNIWTALDALPSTAKWAEFYLINTIQYATGASIQTINARTTGSGAGTSTLTQISTATAIASGDFGNDTTFFKIALDSSLRFDMYRNQTNGTGINCVIVLKAFGT